jgi:hypothetical protein
MPDPTEALSSMAAAASIPAFCCPPGTKMHLLDLGHLEADDGWYCYSVYRLMNTAEALLLMMKLSGWYAAQRRARFRLPTQQASVGL